MARSGFRKTLKSDQDNARQFVERSSLQESKAFHSLTEKIDVDMPSRRPRGLDALTTRLGATGYFHKMRWPWLVHEYGGVKHPLEVSRFYQEQNIAIDIANTPDRFYDTKKELFAANGIRYVHLNSAMDFDSLMSGLT